MNIHEKPILVLGRNHLRRQDECFDAINYGWLHDDAVSTRLPRCLLPESWRRLYPARAKCGGPQSLLHVFGTCPQLQGLSGGKKETRGAVIDALGILAIRLWNLFSALLKAYVHGLFLPMVEWRSLL